MAEREPPPRRLRQLLRQPGARERIAPAVARLLGVGLVAIAAIGALTIWHLIRRGRLIRERLGPPRPARLPDVGPMARTDPERTERPEP